jgi:hypothetical protein
MTCRNRIDPAPAAVKYAAAMSAKRARPVETYAIPADLSIPEFLKAA